MTQKNLIVCVELSVEFGGDTGLTRESARDALVDNVLVLAQEIADRPSAYDELFREEVFND